MRNQLTEMRAEDANVVFTQARIINNLSLFSGNFSVYEWISALHTIAHKLRRPIIINSGSINCIIE